VRPAAIGAWLAGAALLLAGCSSGSVVETAQSPSAEESQTEENGENEENEEDDAHGDLACDDRTREAIDETIGGQLEAFADDDYAAALEFASEAFREEFEASFREVIETSFPEVAQATGHTTTVCVSRGEDAQLLVTVETAASDQELVYQMTLEADEWRIDGALPADAAPSTSEPIEV